MKAWNIFDWLSIIWESDLYEKIKQDFFQAIAVSMQFLRWMVGDRVAAVWLGAALRICSRQHKPFKRDEQNMQGFAGKAGKNAYATFIDSYKDVPMLAD